MKQTYYINKQGSFLKSVGNRSRPDSQSIKYFRYWRGVVLTIFLKHRIKVVGSRKPTMEEI